MGKGESGEAAPPRREMAGAMGEGKGKPTRREQKAAEELETQTSRLKDMDLLHLGKSELETSADDAMNKLAARGKNAHKMDDENAPQQMSAAQRAAQRASEEDDGILINIVNWLLAREKKPPLPWATNRQKEIDDYLITRSFGPYKLISVVLGEQFWYNQIRRYRVNFVGDRDGEGSRENRGICWWPDPPTGGGESYHGLWRADQPHGHGIFRWFDGDKYLGQWNDGQMEGYGVYVYSAVGTHPNDRYEGGYHKGLRQGTGVYKYGSGGVFLGEWLQGKMHGSGFMMYPDGEHYIGLWSADQKHGLGTYVWGPGSGDVAGDKYEGQFKEGTATGLGRTTFADSGYHKGRYYKGKIHGWGVMRTADGYEYIGQWKEDEMHGEFMSRYMYGMAEDTQVQKYDMGDLMGTRKYNSAKDWSEIEAPGCEAARDGQEQANEARKQVEAVTERAKRAKISQTSARNAANEAKYWCKAVIKYREYKLAWYGLKQYLMPQDA